MAIFVNLYLYFLVNQLNLYFLANIVNLYYFPANLDGVGTQTEQVEEVVRRILQQAEHLLPKVEDVQAEQMGDMIDKEMQETSEAIEAAAKRIAVSYQSSHLRHKLRICVVCSL